MNVRFIEPAADELHNAFEYYESTRQGLGLRFLSEVFSLIRRIKKFPYVCPEYSYRSKRCLLRTFPYGIVYNLNEIGGQILVVAIIHLKNKPGYWKDRV